MGTLRRLDCWLENNLDDLYKNIDRKVLEKLSSNANVKSIKINTRSNTIPSKSDKLIFKEQILDMMEKILTQKELRK